MNNFQKMYEFPDFVTVDLYGQQFTALVSPYISGNFRQVRFDIVAIEGEKTQKIRWSEKINAFQNQLKANYPDEWEAFHKG